ncbi:hypothetical protein [Pararhizobium antarcticum]|uniref:hypothetical protein n=1 Tax=Pararhizobium antarcticum TaxID=1798805 RepID=UPI001877651B|nr:hypothetical protein [Pararhizobium antarcticum]
MPLDPALFEALCRGAATRLDVPSFCHLRRCRRGHFCEGKCEPRPIPPMFRGPKDVSALLPTCIACSDDDWFGEFLLEWILCHAEYFGVVRPPRAVRSLLFLDEHWPVFDDVDEEACIQAGGDAIMTHLEAMMLTHSVLIAEIRGAYQAARSEMKGD